MKKITFLLSLLLNFSILYAQVPNAFNYQAVLRNAAGEILSDTNVSIRIGILRDSENGELVFSEVHSVSTNEYGLINLQVGNGLTISGNLSTIDFGYTSHFMQVEIKQNGEANYINLGVSQLLSVPYALQAKTAEKINGESFDEWDKNKNDDVLKTGDQTINDTKTFSSTIRANGIALPHTFGPDTNYVGTPGAFIGFGHSQTSEDFIGYKKNTFYFKDSPGGGDESDPDVVIGGKVGIGVENPQEKLAVDGTIYSKANGFKFPDGTIQITAATGGEGGIADNWGTQVVQHDNSLTGDGTVSNLLSVDNGSIRPEWSNIRNMPGGFIDEVDNINDADHDPANELQTISIDGNQITLSDGGGTIEIPASEGGTGDITSVSAGTGLTGGGASGDVTLNIGVPLVLSADVYAIKGINNNGNFGQVGGEGSGVYGKSANNNWGNIGASDWAIVGKHNNGHFGYIGTALLGVYGCNDNGNYGYLGGKDYSVYGKHISSGNIGQIGTNNYGVYGKHAVAGNYGYLGSGNFGVYGESGSTSDYAGYFKGKVTITGTLSKGAGSFKIDHPLEPEEKYLSHSFVESPDMKNIYDGTVILDNKGEAEITLPEWFGALNKDFRYQLTCIGGFANVYIAEKINNNRFKIAGGRAGLEVSWQVTGIRKDAFAEINPILVEENKKEDEKGKYLHPEAFGLPEEMGIGYEEPNLAEQ